METTWLRLQIDGQLEPCHVHKGEGESSVFPDKGNINARILRSRSFETIRGGKILGGEEEGGRFCKSSGGGRTQTHDEFQTHLKGEDERNLLRNANI